MPSPSPRDDLVTWCAHLMLVSLGCAIPQKGALEACSPGRYRRATRCGVRAGGPMGERLRRVGRRAAAFHAERPCCCCSSKATASGHPMPDVDRQACPACTRESTSVHLPPSCVARHISVTVVWCSSFTASKSAGRSPTCPKARGAAVDDTPGVGRPGVVPCRYCRTTCSVTWQASGPRRGVGGPGASCSCSCRALSPRHGVH